MFRAVHPEVLAPDWLPPVPLGRRGSLASLVRWLNEPLSPTALAGAAIVLGPRGSGTSTLARLGARSWAEGQPLGVGPVGVVQVTIRPAAVHGSQGAAGELLRALDPEYELRGFPVSELLAGFLRRLRTSQRPAVVVIDDLGPDAPDLSRLVAGLVNPGGFLPEGGDGVPPIAVVLAGAPDGLRAISKTQLPRLLSPHTVQLLPYTETELTAIVRDRAERSLARSVPAEWVERVVRRAVRDHGSATRAVDLLRRELVGRDVSELGPVYPSSGEGTQISIEPPLLSALGQLEEGVPVRIGELRERATDLARNHGEPALPATTFWRRIVRLERAGLVRRTVRTGGSGGSLSTVVLVRPLGEWSSLRDLSRTLPAGGIRTELSPMWAAPLGEWDLESRTRRAEPTALPFAMTDDGSA
jgi:hypothetical protein